MTTNEDRVIDALDGMFCNHESGVVCSSCRDEAREAVARLRAEGLIAPDLPEPDRDGNHGPSWEGMVEVNLASRNVAINIGGGQFSQTSGFARAFALALLAAADYAEGEACS